MNTNDIQIIESLYPIDSDFSNTNAIGETLLMEAIRRHDWRKLPAEILQEYRTLCEYQHNKETRGY